MLRNRSEKTPAQLHLNEVRSWRLEQSTLLAIQLGTDAV